MIFYKKLEFLSLNIYNSLSQTYNPNPNKPN